EHIFSQILNNKGVAEWIQRRRGGDFFSIRQNTMVRSKRFGLSNSCDEALGALLEDGNEPAQSRGLLCAGASDTGRGAPTPRHWAIFSSCPTSPSKRRTRWLCPGPPACAIGSLDWRRRWPCCFTSIVSASPSPSASSRPTFSWTTIRPA